ncbi:MAG: hypothetical protein J7621_23990 [Niastella sp.]|nr:hypothetical protein [Niastella sp.]
MTKALSAGLIALLLLGMRPDQPTSATPTFATQAPEVLFYYSWYYDYDRYNPVGTTNTVNGEMARLRNIYPGNTFSATPAWGLHEYEYGFFLYFPLAVIYSDLSTSLTVNKPDSTASQR